MTSPKADKIIDARDMEPPEPFVLTMEALDSLGDDQKLMLILTREPYPLYRALQNKGFAFQSDITLQGTVEILIWRK
jgi:tRNA 2-thiouridine synthesizing protein A